MFERPEITNPLIKVAANVSSVLCSGHLSMFNLSVITTVTVYKVAVHVLTNWYKGGFIVCMVNEYSCCIKFKYS